MNELHTADPAQHTHYSVDDASTIDWHRITFPLGVKTEMTEADPPFLALHAEELEVLHKLLTRGVNGSAAASDEYIGLLTLATWAKRAHEWTERRKK